MLLRPRWGSNPTRRRRHGDVNVTSVRDRDVTERQRERDHLQQEHGLRKVEAWVASATDCNELTRTGSKARMARLRERRRVAGLVTTDVPISILEAVRAAGGWDEWRDALAKIAVRDELERRAGEWGVSPDAVVALLDGTARWRRRVVRWLLSLRASCPPNQRP